MSYRPIVGNPRLTQDWGTEQHERETHWTSLFYDLMLVAALNAIAEPFEEFEEGEGEGESMSPTLTPVKHLMLDAGLQFFSVVNPWNALNEITAMFEDESLVGHLSFFFHSFGLAATTAGCVGELSENYRVLGTGIILAKFGLLLLYVRPVLAIPRARVHSVVRCLVFTGNICLMLWGMSFQGPDAFLRFRKVLIAGTLWDWFAGLAMVVIPKEQRVPWHIQSYSDRIKEVTMVIFGEAIFAIILQPFTEAKPQTHFYCALATTLWVIYALALQEFHILPSTEDHALRRSIFFAVLWYYAQLFKQFCLLVTSIGIKRAHLLIFESPDEPIDRGTRNLLVWGFSLTMFAVVMIRSFSFGFGRHPSKDDPPALYRLKMSWWVILSLACLLPQIVDLTIIQFFPQPLAVLAALGIMMGLIILMEAAMSNAVADHVKKWMVEAGAASSEEVNEITYLRSPSSEHSYTSGEVHAKEAEDVAPFLNTHAPKSNGGS